MQKGFKACFTETKETDEMPSVGLQPSRSCRDTLWWTELSTTPPLSLSSASLAAARAGLSGNKRQSENPLARELSKIHTRGTAATEAQRIHRTLPPPPPLPRPPPLLPLPPSPRFRRAWKASPRGDSLRAKPDSFSKCSWETGYDILKDDNRF